MQVFGPKSLSKFLYYGAIFVMTGYIIMYLFIIFSYMTNSIIANDAIFKIQIPFSDSVITGEYKGRTAVALSGFFIFYSLFFFSLARIFTTFSKNTLFTKKAIKRLSQFALINTVFPIIYAILQFIFIKSHFLNDFSVVILHLFIGLFTSFIIAIFRHGFLIQEENELTI